MTSSVSSKRLAHVSDRATATVADHGGAERRTIAAVGLVDPLDDLLAPFVFEIDVDIRGFLAGGADEALEEQVGAGGIDGSDAEDVADRAIGGAAAALAEDVLRAGEADDAVHREEVGRIRQLIDQAELVAELMGDGIGTPSG